MRRISVSITLIFAVLACGCASPNLIDKPLLVAPPLPERYLNGNFLEYYPDASKRAHESGEVIVDFAIAPCGNVPHSPGPDYFTLLCIDPIPPIPFQTGPEFMMWPEEFELTLEERKSLRDQNAINHSGMDDLEPRSAHTSPPVQRNAK